MAQVVTQTAQNYFKRVYGDITNLLTEDYILSKEIPFKQEAKVGDSYVIALTLAREGGITYAGTAQTAFAINPGSAGATKQARVIPSQSILTSVLALAFISRGVSSEASFANTTKDHVKNHLSSHEYFREVSRWYGQSTELLGTVSYAPTGTLYRGATYTGSGTVTLTRPADGSTIAFTAGINVDEKAILMAPGQYAAGFWAGNDTSVRVLQVDSTGAIVASGLIIGTDVDLGIVYVDFVPVAATSTTSHRLCFEGMESGQDAVGVHRILSNVGTLFEISAATFSLYRANVLSLGQKKFNLKALQFGVSQAVNRGALNKPLMIFVNPRTFASMSNDEASLRKYDASYKSAQANNGFEAIEYFAANGANQVVAYNMIKEGHAFGLEKASWVRSGSAEVSFKIPGFSEADLIFPLENQAGFVLRSYSDEFIICKRPCWQILWKDIDSDGVDY